MKTIIWILRHGNTTADDRIKDILPYPLSPKGRKQIESMGKFLSKKKISKIYASPTRRTLQTSNIVRKYLHEAKIIVCRDLVEWRMPKWAGIEEGILKEKFPEEYENNLHHATKFKMGEPVGKMKKRMLKIFWCAFRENKGGECLLVSHKAPINSLVFPLKRISIDNIANARFPKKGDLARVVIEGSRVKSIKFFKNKIR